MKQIIKLVAWFVGGYIFGWLLAALYVGAMVILGRHP